jgi:hypothetical protein
VFTFWCLGFFGTMTSIVAYSCPIINRQGQAFNQSVVDDTVENPASCD